MCVKPYVALQSFNGYKWFTKIMPWGMDENVNSSEAFAEAQILAERFRAEGGGMDARAVVFGCGQCHECRLQRSRMWANRCILEMDQYRSDKDGINKNWFVTYTYDPDHEAALYTTRGSRFSLTLHNPFKPKMSLEKFSQKHPELSLRQRLDAYHEYLQLPPERGKDHLQMVNNAIRKKWDEKYNHEGVRFYGCGEYGDQTYRPHYHEILFNLPIDPSDLKPLFTNKFGHKYFTVDALSDSWGKGFVVVSEANWTNCAYVARYIMKKLNGDLGVEAYDKVGIKPPFTRMSRRPGIGGAFYKGPEHYFLTEDLKLSIDLDTGELMCDPDELLSQQPIHDKVYLPFAGQGAEPVIRPPRYYDKLFQAQYPESFKVVQDHRREILEKYQKQSKIECPVSDLVLFKAREEEFEKHKIGVYRHFIDSL